jgi:hypothetical protein
MPRPKATIISAAGQRSRKHRERMALLIGTEINSLQTIIFGLKATIRTMLNVPRLPTAAREIGQAALKEDN